MNKNVFINTNVQNQQFTQSYLDALEFTNKIIETLLLPHVANGFPTKFCGEEIYLKSCEHKHIKLQWKNS